MWLIAHVFVAVVYRQAVVASIIPLPWEIPYVPGVALKRKKINFKSKQNLKPEFPVTGTSLVVNVAKPQKEQISRRVN